LAGGTAQGGLGPCPRPDHANGRCAYPLAASKAGTDSEESTIDPHGPEAGLQTGRRVRAGCGTAAPDRLSIEIGVNWPVAAGRVLFPIFVGGAGRRRPERRAPLKHSPAL